MKTLFRFALGLCFSVVSTLSAQTLFTDSLASASSDWSNTPAARGGGVLAFFTSGGTSALGYSVGTPTIDDAGFQTLVSQLVPATGSGSVQVDVHLAAMSGLTTGQYANLNLIVVKSSDGENFNSTFALDRYHNGTTVIQDFDTYVTTAGVQTHLTEVLNATTSATLKISYDADARQFIYGYDVDGLLNGSSFTTAHTVDISGWGLTGSDTLMFLLVGGSGTNPHAGPGPSINSVDAYFQNFAITGSGAAVPEPSAYAAALGLAALAVVLRRRWSRPRTRSEDVVPQET